MTTPERLRRRQRIEGTILILLAIFTALQAVYFSLERQEDRRETDNCISKKFYALSVALDERSKLTAQETVLAQRESEQNRALWGLYAEAAGIIDKSGKSPQDALTPEQIADLNERLVAQLLEYRDVMNETVDEREQILADRKKNPLPPYPVGTCNAG